MSRFDYLQGRAHASLMITSAFSRPDAFTASSGVGQVLDNLTSALSSHPVDYARGIQEVINEVRRAVPQ